MTKLHRSQWLNELKSEFPELRGPLNAERGLISFEMGVFLRFTIKMISEDNRAAVKKCYAIAFKYYQAGTQSLRDVIDTCYVEDLDFREQNRVEKEWAWNELPSEFKELYQDFHSPG